MQQYAVAGWPVAGLPESQLSRVADRIREVCRKIIELLNQPGNPL
ncbi:Lambda Phage CIII, antitermination protein [Sodalis praecaptivus]|uniref:Lambda Phage CIII, antitermination protein n=1 Tax=Sodalis praecaptivus TaxID=1239307 RepID=W0HZM4_9GAMM|nr:protease FtsH-inhibitory lysogeny factor CIII [Sodalis praecaptivus]AHF77942.1 Lambda Phage CIII, antitermination protein [Sodalis praecaptivus]